MGVTLNERIYNYNRSIKLTELKARIKLFESYSNLTGKFTDISKHIIISGEPRGGTTWLMELMMEPEMNYIWEPLFFRILAAYKNVSGFDKQLGFMPYIPENEKWPEAETYFRQLFTAKVIHPQTILAYPKPAVNIFASRLLFKFCRANMLLPWLTTNFNIQPIYVVRHPLSVYSSQLKHKAFDGMGSDYNLFKLQQSKYNYIFEKHHDKISKINSPETMFANWWAINNIVPLSSNLNNKKWITVSYESLLLNPITELERIYSRLGLALPDNMQSRINKPSATTVKTSNIMQGGGNQLLSWKKYVPEHTADTILGIIHSYGITAYTKQPEPDYKQLGI